MYIGACFPPIEGIALKLIGLISVTDTFPNLCKLYVCLIYET